MQSSRPGRCDRPHNRAVHDGELSRRCPSVSPAKLANCRIGQTRVFEAGCWLTVDWGRRLTLRKIILVKGSIRLAGHMVTRIWWFRSSIRVPRESEETCKTWSICLAYNSEMSNLCTIRSE